MAYNILIAFDDSPNAMRAVEHVAKFFNPSNKVTLLSILHDTAALCDMNSPELTAYFLSQRSSFCAIEEKKKSLIEGALKEGKQVLINAGFNDENVIIKAIVKNNGIARDIVDEATSSGYDIIVMGRRGLSGIKEFFLGSVSQKVLHGAREVSILMVN
ncbi:universal stress protein [Desulfobacterales bacterium HSG16]|nr:universal stress protein [Desulfobacterales bacterium HSG16]